MCGTKQSMLITQTGNQIGPAFYLLDNFGFFRGNRSSAFHGNSICAHNHVYKFETFLASVLMNDLRPFRPLLDRFQSFFLRHWNRHVRCFRGDHKEHSPQVCQFVGPSLAQVWKAHGIMNVSLQPTNADTPLSYPFAAIALCWLWYNEQK